MNESELRLLAYRGEVSELQNYEYQVEIARNDLQFVASEVGRLLAAELTRRDILQADIFAKEIKRGAIQALRYRSESAKERQAILGAIDEKLQDYVLYYTKDGYISNDMFLGKRLSTFNRHIHCGVLVFAACVFAAKDEEDKIDKIIKLCDNFTIDN